MKQLARTINGITYYCEFITPDILKAKSKKNAAKYAEFKARIIKVSGGFGVFIH